jgi:hypothetical protein
LPVPGGVATVATAPVVVDAAATSAFDAHEPGGVECRLIDQASHLDVLLAAPWPALPPRVPAPLPAAAHTARTAGATPAYLARGPPRGEGEARRIVHA